MTWGIEGSVNQGCVRSLAGITNDLPTFGVLGGSSLVSSLWAGSDNDHSLCDYHRYQPSGQMSVRGITARWNGSAWVLCRDTGTLYNGSTAWSMVVSSSMGTLADCGSGYYHQESTSRTYDSSSWHTNYITSGSKWMN